MATFWLFLFAVALATALIAETWLLVHLRRQGEALDRRSAALERVVAAQSATRRRGERGTAPFAAGLPAQSILNDFALPDATGRTVTFSGLRGRPLAVLFVQPDCPHSRQVIAAVAHRPPDGREVAFVTTGEREENRRLFAGMPEAIRLLFQEETEVARVWRVQRTPSLYLIDAAGVTEGELRVGAAAALHALELAEEDVPPSPGDSSPFAARGGLFPRPPQLGEVVPDLEVRLLSDRTATLHSARSTLLLVIDQRCAACRAGLPELAGRLGEASGRVRILLLSSGEEADARALAAMVGPMVDVSPQPDYAVMRRLGLLAAPSALLVDGDGAVLAEAAIGYEAIAALLPSTQPAGAAA